MTILHVVQYNHPSLIKKIFLKMHFTILVDLAAYSSCRHRLFLHFDKLKTFKLAKNANIITKYAPTKYYFAIT